MPAVLCTGASPPRCAVDGPPPRAVAVSVSQRCVFARKWSLRGAEYRRKGRRSDAFVPPNRKSRSSENVAPVLWHRILTRHATSCVTVSRVIRSVLAGHVTTCFRGSVGTLGVNPQTETGFSTLTNRRD